MKYCSNKDIDQLIRQLIHYGWHFQNGRKHGRLTSPDGRRALTVSRSPSDCRSLYNFRRDLQKATTPAAVMQP
jgi:hypothetical protein